MKGLIIVLITVLVTSCASKKASFSTLFSPIATELVTIDAKLRAESFASTYLKNCNAQDVLSNEQFSFTQDAENVLNDEKMIKSCAEIQDSYGNLESISLQEIQGDGSNILAYRFKGVFDQSTQPIEVRVYELFTQDFVGIIVIPWEQEMRSGKLE